MSWRLVAPRRRLRGAEQLLERPPEAAARPRLYFGPSGGVDQLPVDVGDEPNHLRRREPVRPRRGYGVESRSAAPIEIEHQQIDVICREEIA